MGSRKGDKEDLLGNEAGNPEKLIIGYPYWIARYPVTVAQFRCFMEAGGYEEPGWWTKTGWDWRQGKWDSRIKDVLIRDWLRQRPVELRSTPWEWNEQRGYPSRPAVGVSWFEAMAYCRWLDARMKGVDPGREGYIVRLPTEAEWEKAARSGDSRRYVWGNDPWDEERANISDSGIGHPTSVGMYPQGATPTSSLDVIGNVWEWALSLYRDYPYKPEDGRNDLEAEGARVVRGGSWNGDRRLARCSVRGWDCPDFFDPYCGFRVVLSLASSGF